AVARRVEILEPAGSLHGLERHAAHATLLQREVEDLPDLSVVQALLQRHDQRGREVVLVQAIERAPADVAQINAAKRSQLPGPQRIELEVNLESRHVVL